MKWFGRLAAAVAAAASLHAQARVVVTDVGAGPSGRMLREAVRQPYVLATPDSGWYLVPRGTEVPTTLIVLGRTAAIAGTVRGDVVVVGGDLFIRPGGHVTGSAIAIGGAVYPSSLGYVEGTTWTFRDNTFAITRTSDGSQLDYRSLEESPATPDRFPGVYGLRLPSYDRVDGLSVPFGPARAIDSGRVEANALATYRSNLGKVDPGIDLSARLTRRIRIEARARRATLSNDDWIYPDVIQSASAAFLGLDTRNYYRADRIEGTLHQRWEFNSATIEPFVGARSENAWSVGSAALDRHGVWSVFGRSDSLRMWRPNPAIEPGRMSSVLAGATVQWQGQGATLEATSVLERPFAAPASERFEQVTSHLAVTFPTFGEQEYAMDAHWMTTAGDTAPPQRFAYLGGPGTLPFLDLLSEGGDELLLIDQRYSIPLPGPSLGILGAPTILLRHRLGSAGVGTLPSFRQMLGLGVKLAVVRAEVDIDPAQRTTRFGAGFWFTR